MTIRCGCPDESDEIVFGPDHQCSREGRAAVNLQAELDRLEAKPVDLLGALAGAIDRARKVRREDFTLSPPEPRYMETLDEAERQGD